MKRFKVEERSYIISAQHAERSSSVDIEIVEDSLEMIGSCSEVESPEVPTFVYAALRPADPKFNLAESTSGNIISATNLPSTNLHFVDPFLVPTPPRIFPQPQWDCRSDQRDGLDMDSTQQLRHEAMFTGEQGDESSSCTSLYLV